MVLKAKGFLTTTRGVHGGYLLARTPERINLLDVVEALEGEISLVDCLDECTPCQRESTCVTKAMWQKLRTAITDILHTTTLKDLLKAPHHERQHET
jgi:Rrf2 family protein